MIADLNEDGRVLLEWNFFRICFGWFCDPIVEGSRYEIFAKYPGENDFVRIERLGKDELTYLLANVAHGKPYEFYVAAHRAGQVTTSNTVMIVPTAFPEYETIMKIENGDGIFFPKVNIQGEKVAYISNFRWNENGQDYMTLSLFIKNLVTGESEMIRKSCYHPQWSVDGKKVVYGTTAGLERIAPGYTPIHLEIYDLESKESKLVNAGLHHHNFPNFTMDNQSLVFLSDSLDRRSMGLWRLNSEGASEVLWPNFQLPDQAVGLPLFTGVNASYLSDWVAVDNLRTVNNMPVYNIYGFEIEGDIQEKEIIVSQWNDMAPSFSPFDENMLAFVSNRSGRYQVWAIDLVTGVLRQLSFFKNDFYLDFLNNPLSWVDQGRGVAVAGVNNESIQKLVKAPFPN